MKRDGKVIAFIDLGTNSVRLLVVKLNPNFSYTVISQEKEVVRLGEREFNDELLKPEAMRRTILVCKNFAELAKTYGASEIIAVATSATREASNRDEFIGELRAKADIDIKVISGLEEARLTYLGVSSGVDIGDKKAVFVDIGGGSTEISIGDQFNLYYLDSFPVGAIRLTSAFIREEWPGSVSASTYENIFLYAKNVILRATSVVKRHNIETAFGSSGTIVNLAEIANRMFDKPNDSKGLILGRKQLKKVVEELCSLPLEERRKIPGINPERADIIIGGAAIIDALMDNFDLKEVIVSTRGLRDGMLEDYISKIPGFPHFQKTPIKERSVIQLGRLCNFDEKHSYVVATLALQLFDSSKRMGLHNYGNEEKDFLKYSAMLHDIGDFISFNNHHLHSYYIISNAEMLLGFNQQEVKLIANIARFHRKKYPNTEMLEEEGFDAYSKRLVIVLSMLLRFAENLDRSHAGLIKSAEFNEADENSVALKITSDSQFLLEEWSLKNNVGAFHKVFGMELRIIGSLSQAPLGNISVAEEEVD